jgi:hypothetical protein
MSLEANLDLVRAGNRAIAAHDIEGALHSIHPDYKLNIVLQPRSLMTQGLVANSDMMRAMLANLFHILPDCTITEKDLRASNKSVYLEVVLAGTHCAPMKLPTGASIPPSRLRVEIPIEVYSIFDEAGDLVGSTCYVSLSNVLKQAGISEQFLEH